MDSRTIPSPAVYINTFLCFPSTDKPGTRDIAIKIMLTGKKQAIKSEEIVTTILATFKWRVKTSLPCNVTAVAFRQVF